MSVLVLNLKKNDDTDLVYHHGKSDVATHAYMHGEYATPIRVRTDPRNDGQR